MTIDNYDEIEQQILKLQLPDHLRVLDIGTRGAIFGRMFLDKHIQAEEVFALDKEDVIDFAKSIPLSPELEPKLHFIDHDLEANDKLPFPDNSFDLVFIANGTKVMFLDGYLEEYKRILSPIAPAKETSS